jgi:hypothetical protein
MQCPLCGGHLEMRLCPLCGAETLPEGSFCCRCGGSLEIQELPPDLANRVLCPDGACIGILNDQGECSVCGLAYKVVLEPETSHDG